MSELALLLLYVIILAGGAWETGHAHRVTLHYYTQGALHVALYSWACIFWVRERSPFLIEAMLCAQE